MSYQQVTEPLKKSEIEIAEIERVLAQVIANRTGKTRIVVTVNYYENGTEGLMMSVSFQEM